jgi:type IV pilus assembly protein PilV
MRTQSGFSLLEVLVAGAILAVGLAGIAALLLRSIAATQWAESRTTASFLADSLAAWMRVSPDQEATFAGTPPAPEGPRCMAPGSCPPGQFARDALAWWQADVAASLPGGSGLVCRDGTPRDGTAGSPQCDGAGMLVIKIFWQERLRGPDTAGRHAVLVAP